MTADLYQTTDAENLFQKINSLMADNNKKSISIILNKIDNIEKDSENIEEIICDIRKTICQKYRNIETVIFPVSAKAAKLFRMKQKGMFLSGVEKKEIKYVLNDKYETEDFEKTLEKTGIKAIERYIMG